MAALRSPSVAWMIYCTVGTDPQSDISASTKT
jgi:hypothetical protein